MNSRLYLVLLIFGISGPVHSDTSDRKVANSPVSRFTWKPGDHFKEGYRNAPWVRDPFFPDTKDFRLAGVISNEYAYINGSWLRVGETIEGYTVRKIAHDEVVLARNAETILLRLSE